MNACYEQMMIELGTSGELFQKNYSKQVGNEWTELSEEQQQPYEAMFAAKVEEHEKATEAYEAALEQWEQQKGQPAP